MKLRLTDAFWNSEYAIETKNDSGVMVLDFEKNSRSTLFYHTFKVKITTDVNEYVREDIGNPDNDDVIVHYRKLLSEQDLSIEVRDYKEINGKHKCNIHYKRVSSDTSTAIERLKKLDTIDTKLRFRNMSCKNNGDIEIEYDGHGVDGSYVYAEAVVPGYLEVLTKIGNRLVEFVGRKHGSFQSDIYTFKFDMGKVIDEDLEKEYNSYTGKVFDINGAYAFRTCPGEDWAMMYGIYEQLKYFHKFLVMRNDVIYYTDLEDKEIKLFKKYGRVTEKDVSTVNSGRTHFTAKFELFVDHYVLRTKYLEIHNRIRNVKGRYTGPSAGDFKIKVGSSLCTRIGHI